MGINHHFSTDSVPPPIDLSLALGEQTASKDKKCMVAEIVRYGSMGYRRQAMEFLWVKRGLSLIVSYGILQLTLAPL